MTLRKNLIFSTTDLRNSNLYLNPHVFTGDKVVCYRYGLFSHLWVDMAQRLGLDVTVLDEEWGRGADEARFVCTVCIGFFINLGPFCIYVHV